MTFKRTLKSKLIEVLETPWHRHTSDKRYKKGKSRGNME